MQGFKLSSRVVGRPLVRFAPKCVRGSGCAIRRTRSMCEGQVATVQRLHLVAQCREVAVIMEHVVRCGEPIRRHGAMSITRPSGRGRESEE